jgi:hypothetical protein
MPSFRFLLPGRVVACLALCATPLAPCAAQQAPKKAVVSAPVTPKSVTVSADKLKPRPPTGPEVTVPEGKPSLLRPPPRVLVVDPRIQLDVGPLTRDRDRMLLPDRVKAVSVPRVVPGITARSNPPDTIGDIGRDHYVQMVNSTEFQVFDKNTGGSVLGPAAFHQLWPSQDICGTRCSGENCTRGGSGDPVVIYDHLADRWLLSQFAHPNHMCIAISQTGDPTSGKWFLYEFDTKVFPDYPKFGLWPDGYYMSSYERPNLGIYVFDRASMLAGKQATLMKQTIPALGGGGVRDTRILPANLDGPPPPARTPNFFVRTVDDQQDRANPRDRVEIYSAAANFATKTFTFTLVSTLDPLPFQIMLCNRNGDGARDCIPQPGTQTSLDALSNRPMAQLRYRNFGTHQAMVFNQTIDVAGSMPIPVKGEVAGIRWYELRAAGQGLAWSIFQQGTFAPQPAGAKNEKQLLHRWMGSIAMDKSGNIALAYSVTNDDDKNTVFPGVRFAGRHADDPAGTLPLGEITLYDGVNWQPPRQGGKPARWGDYSALGIDQTDGCTFWFTTHVARDPQTHRRPTQIAAFKVDDTCK